MNKQLIEQAATIYSDTYGFLKDTVVIKAAFITGAEFTLSKWIPVNEQLPEKNCPDGAQVLGTNGKMYYIICYTSGMQIEIADEVEGNFDISEDKSTKFLKPGWYECSEQHGGMYDEIWIDRSPTHWMPLPTKPTT